MKKLLFSVGNIDVKERTLELKTSMHYHAKLIWTKHICFTHFRSMRVKECRTFCVCVFSLQSVGLSQWICL